MEKAGRIIYNVLLLAYIAAVIYLCFGRFEHIPQVPELWFNIPKDKAVHFIMFFPYVFLTYKSIGIAKTATTRRRWLSLSIIIVVGLLFAILTEKVQGLLGYRTCDIRDFYADALGLLSGTLLALLFKN